MNILSFIAGSGAIVIIGLIIVLFTKDCFLQLIIKKIDQLADKEDIQKIEKIVNQLEDKFISESQDIKKNLTITYQTGTSSINEERDAIVEFNKNYFAWFELYSTMYTIGGLVNNSEIEDYLRKVESLNLEVIYSIVNVEFFVKDPKLNSIINELKQKTLESFEDINLDLVKYFKTSNIELDILNTFHEKHDSEESIVELFEIRTSKYKEFSNKAIPIKKEIVRKQKEVLDYCKNYILSLSKI